MHHTNLFTRAAALLCAAAFALTLTACDPGDGPEPTPTTPTTGPATTDPSTEPSTEPSLSHQDEQVAAAQAFVEAYFAEVSAVGNDGYQDWEDRLQPFFAGTPDLWISDVRVGWEALANRGGHTTGSIEVISFRTTDWQEDPTESGFDIVSFEVCLDTSAVTDFSDDGAELEQQPQDEPYLATVTVMGQPDSDFGWSFTDYAEELEATC